MSEVRRASFGSILPCRAKRVSVYSVVLQLPHLPIPAAVMREASGGVVTEPSLRAVGVESKNG